MGRVAHPLSFGGFITTEGAPSLRPWQGWDPRTYNSPVLTFGNLGSCWGLANAFTTRPSRLPHPCRVLCDRWGLLTLFSRRARHQNPRPVAKMRRDKDGATPGPFGRMGYPPNLSPIRGRLHSSRRSGTRYSVPDVSELTFGRTTSLSARFTVAAVGGNALVDKPESVLSMNQAPPPSPAPPPLGPKV